MKHHAWLAKVVRLSAPLLFVSVALILAGCGTTAQPDDPAQQIPNSDPSAGKAVMTQYGCASCHVIPGVAGANGKVGPPLNDFAERKYVAGLLPNQPDNLIYWIRYPQRVVNGVAMPNMDVTEQDARNIAAYLYTLH
jgi:cytochrome c